MVRGSAEERDVIARIRAALANGLELGGGLLFLHQEWRFPNREKLDVLALDSSSGQLVVIEAKALGRIYSPARQAVHIDGAALPRCELWWPGALRGSESSL